MNDEVLLSRCNPGLVVSRDVYLSGLLDTMDYLILELESMLKEEGRFFGIVKSYYNSIHEAYSKIYSETAEDDSEIYGKILYLFKPIFKSEFSFLSNSRHLSKADAVIVILHRMTDIMIDLAEDYPHKNELKTINKVVTRLYDNIRNRGKEASLFKFSNALRTFIDSGVVGKFTLEQFSFQDSPKEDETLVRSGVRIKDESEDKIIEVTLE